MKIAAAPTQYVIATTFSRNLNTARLRHCCFDEADCVRVGRNGGLLPRPFSIRAAFLSSQLQAVTRELTEHSASGYRLLPPAPAEGCGRLRQYIHKSSLCKPWIAARGQKRRSDEGQTVC